MRRTYSRLFWRWPIGVCLLVAFRALADPAISSGPRDVGIFTLDYSPWEYHWNHDPKNNNRPNLVTLEWEMPGALALFGACYFSNSFSQDCGYFYVGKRWFMSDIFGSEDPHRGRGLYFKLTAGPLIGYSGRHEKDIPFNHKGLGWVAIPLFGYQYKRCNVQAGLFSNAGILATVGFDVFR